MQLARKAKHADLVATLRFRTEAEGGRTSELPTNHLNAILTIGERNFDVRLQLSGASILPGQTSVVSMNFLDPDGARRFVRVGQDVTLRDYRVIAEGKVESADFGSA